MRDADGAAAMKQPDRDCRDGKICAIADAAERR
jgi:hypothetical protein